jgi:hypothetical protein
MKKSAKCLSLRAGCVLSASPKPSRRCLDIESWLVQHASEVAAPLQVFEQLFSSFCWPLIFGTGHCAHFGRRISSLVRGYAAHTTSLLDLPSNCFKDIGISPAPADLAVCPCLLCFPFAPNIITADAVLAQALLQWRDAALPLQDYVTMPSMAIRLSTLSYHITVPIVVCRAACCLMPNPPQRHPPIAVAPQSHRRLRAQRGR